MTGRAGTADKRGTAELTAPAGWTELRLRDGDASGGLVVCRARGDALVSDLARSLGSDEVAGLLVDGRLTREGDRLDEVGLCQGSIVRRLGAGWPTVGAAQGAGGVGPRGWAVATLVTRDGLDAGRRLELLGGTYLVGSAQVCDLVLGDPGVQPLHASLEVRPSGEVMVTWLDGVGEAEQRLLPGHALRIGTAMWWLEASNHHDGPRWVDPVCVRGPRGTIVLNRPPRSQPAAPAERVAVPVPPVPARPVPLAAAGVVLPLVVAGVLVVVTGNWAFAALTALSPCTAVASWWMTRRSSRRTGRGDGRRHAEELLRFAVVLQQTRSRCDGEVARRCLDVAEVGRRVHGPAATLWERRLDHADAARVRLGWAVQRWPAAPVLDIGAGSATLDPAAADVVDAVEAPQDSVVELDLMAHPILGIVGDRLAAAAVARSVVLQLTAIHGPADLDLLVVPGAEQDWAWTTWLPHGRIEIPSGMEAVEAALAEARAVSASGQPFLGGRNGDAARAGAVAPASGSASAGQVRRRLLVVDDESAWVGRSAPVRAALRGEAGPVIGVVVAESAKRLPAMCRLVLEVRADGQATLTRMYDGTILESIAAMGASKETSERLAADLARYEDPDLDLPDAGLPNEAGLLELLRADPQPLEDVVARRWRASAARPQEAGLRATLGIGVDGPVVVDLVSDGPHALVAGTTGAGKSELLRSWVAALAVGYSPAACNVVLLDFKGGSAFDACAALPHTVAVVSDLDGELAGRVLQCLQAELRHRELLLREAGVGDLTDLHERSAAAGRPPVLARLVVVVDEFATLAAEHPRFLESLVGIAQRGRSLGVHLILATQRPAGVVSEQIKANTNIRIALRVQDRADSLDVIEQPDAADRARQRPGRAYVRLGRHEVTVVQTCFSGCVGRADPAEAVVVVERGGVQPDGPGGRGRADGDAVPDLALVVGAAQRAAAALGLAPPRVPWPDPLPDRVGEEELRAGTPATAVTGHPPFFLLDDPDRQRRMSGGWDPRQGNLLVFGTTGSGATSALLGCVAAAAAAAGPDRLHVHLIADDPVLMRLDRLAHVGTVVRRTDTERRTRLLWWLDAELRRRRHDLGRDGAGRDGAGLTVGCAIGSQGSGSPVDRPDVLVVIDGLGSLLAELNGSGHLADEADRLGRLLVDGPAHGLYTVATVEHASSVRHGLLASVTQRIVLRTADPLDARQLGVAPVAGPPGRGRETGSGRLLQIVDPAVVLAGLDELAGRRPGTGAACACTPFSAGHLPETVQAAAWDDGRTADGSTAAGSARVGSAFARRAAVGPAVDGRTVAGIAGAWGGEGPRTVAGSGREGGIAGWTLVGLGGPDLSEQGWWLPPGSAALVAGPRRSGRSTVLVQLARRIGCGGPGAGLVAWTPRPSPLRAEHITLHVHGDQLDPGLIAGLTAGGNGALPVLLVDDAEDTEDPAAVVSSALGAGWVVIAAGRSDALRSAYGHWTRQVRSSRQGLLLQPDVDLDGELLGVRLPRRAEASLRPVGRGYLVADAEPVLVQAFMPPASQEA